MVKAFQKILDDIEGIYTIAAIHVDNPEQIVSVRSETPLVIGLGNGENYVASDIYAILKYTQQIIYPDDFQIVSVTSNEVKVFDRDLKEIDFEIEGLNPLIPIHKSFTVHPCLVII